MSKLSKAIANAIIEFNAGLLTQDELYAKLEQDIDNVSVKVWREDKSVPLPTYGKEGDACCDVYAKSIKYDEEKDRTITLHSVEINTKNDIIIKNIKEGYMMAGVGAPGYLEDIIRKILEEIYLENKEQKDEDANE